MSSQIKRMKNDIFHSYSSQKNEIINNYDHRNSEKKFNWTENRINLKDKKIKEEERKKLEKMYIKTLQKVQELEIYTGIITNVTDRIVLVDIGFKAEGAISINEFREDLSIAQLGNKIEVMVVKIDYKGDCILSYQKSKMLRNWQKINEVSEKSEVVLAFVKARTKGGLILELFNIECFLPGSHINVKPVRDYDNYVGKTMEVKVVKINQKTKNVVVSHKVLIERDLEEQKKEMISKLEKGQVLEGKIKNILPYGAFVDLGGVDALLHITDMSWQHITHPTEIVQLEQKLKFVVLGVDQEKNRVQLGLKQLQEHPWDTLDKSLKIGSKISGKVSVLADYGAFVEILPGVEALLHISEMSWNIDLSSPKDFVQIGEKIDALILTIDRKERKMSLSVKQLFQDPWIHIKEKYSVGSKHIGIVKKFTNFGLLIELDKEISGILYTNDLSWIKKIKHPSEFCSINKKLEVIVLSLDTQSRKLSLGHKQLIENPWNNYEKIYSIGSVHKGLILNSFEKGATVQFQIQNQDKEKSKVEAFVPFRFLEKKNGGLLKKGEEALFKVIEFNKEIKKIVVSHTSIYNDKKISKKNETKKRIGKSRKFEKSTLGDIEGLARLKEQIEKEKK